MLLPDKPRSAYPRCPSVGENLRQHPGIFVRNYAGDGPTDGRMLRRKRISALKKFAAPIAGEWALPPEGVSENFGIHKCVNPSFAAE